MTNRRRLILTILSLSFGMLLAAMIFYLKWGQFSDKTWLSFLTVFGYSALIVIAIGWFLQRRSRKNDS
jgi:cytochrome bd-type quinol oxidase subunit 1